MLLRYGDCFFSYEVCGSFFWGSTSLIFTSPSPTFCVTVVHSIVMSVDLQRKERNGLNLKKKSQVFASGKCLGIEKLNMCSCDLSESKNHTDFICKCMTFYKKPTDCQLLMTSVYFIASLP